MRREALAAAMALALLLGACGGSGSSGEEAPSIAPDCADVTGGTSFSVELVDYAFHPRCLIVGADEPFTLTNTGEAVHTFTIEEQGIDIELGPGDTETSQGLGIPPGVYLLRCTLHEQMLGTIAVR